MASTRAKEIGVGALVLVALGLLAIMAIRIGAVRGLGDTLQVSAVLPDASGVTEGASVKVAGVEVGRVGKLGVEHDHARVEFELKESAGLRRDVILQVRARSVLGEKYVELRPVSLDAPLLTDGDTIEHITPTTEIDQLVNAMGPLLGALDPAALQTVIEGLSTAMAEDPERAGRMLVDLETLLHNAALASEEAPATLAEARATLASVRRATDEARPSIRKAEALIDRLDAATAELPATAKKVDGLVDETRAAVADGRKLLGEVEGSTDDLKLVLANLSEIDKWELRRLLREEGIVVRLKSKEVVEE